MRCCLTIACFCCLGLPTHAASVFEFTATVLSLDQRLSTNEASYGKIWGQPIHGRIILEPTQRVATGLHPRFPGVPLGQWTLETSPRSSLLVSFGSQHALAFQPQVAEAPNDSGVNVMQPVSDGVTEFVELYLRGDINLSLDFQLPDTLAVADLAIYTKDGVIEARVDRIVMVPEPTGRTYALLAVVGIAMRWRFGRRRA